MSVSKFKIIQWVLVVNSIRDIISIYFELAICRFVSLFSHALITKLNLFDTLSYDELSSINLVE